MSAHGLPAGTQTAGTNPALAQLDTSRANAARIYDRWLGGKDNFAADRDVADEIAGLAPWTVAGARANRAFLNRAITHLARSGVRQFLDLGAGLPTRDNVHTIAQRVRPDARTVYVDHDAIVILHARALLARDEQTVAVQADLREPAAVLDDPTVRTHLDWHSPVAVLMAAVLHFVPPEDAPAAIAGAFRAALVPGSHLVISHVADLPAAAWRGGRSGHDPRARIKATREAADRYAQLTGPFVLRTPEEIRALFTGFDLLAPGLVPVNRWGPNGKNPGRTMPVLAGVGKLRHPDG